MLQRSDGFFLTELLLSLSAFLMAASFIIPIAVRIINEIDLIRKEQTAVQLLYDELQIMNTQGSVLDTSLLNKYGQTYRMTMLSKEDGRKEVCIYYNGRNGNEVQKCEDFE